MKDNNSSSNTINALRNGNNICACCNETKSISILCYNGNSTIATLKPQPTYPTNNEEIHCEVQLYLCLSESCLFVYQV